MLGRLTSSVTKMTGHHNSRLVAVCQMNVTNNLEENLEQAEGLVEKAAKRGAEVVFLPEAADFIGVTKHETALLSQSLEGDTVASFRRMALEYMVWLSVGGLHIRTEKAEKTSNCHLLIDSCGTIVERYDKTHLFDVHIPEKVSLTESQYVETGNRLAIPLQTPIGRLGLGVCYDLRFPEHSLALARAGAEILTFPSAFTVSTGLAHWETLLRARAIETQCYVVAAAQVGQHNSKRASYGHAMIVDPWGAVVAQCKDGVGLAMAEIDLHYLHQIRSNMPVQSQRRPELYGNVAIRDCTNSKILSDDFVFEFGPNARVSGGSVFFMSDLSLAFVNKKPVVEGHVLISPLRSSVVKLADLTESEMADLFVTVNKVDTLLQSFYGVDSSTVTVQNGVLAGQSIPHVHVHVLPRRKGDFTKNDDVYKELEEHDKVDGGWRDEETMAEEAMKYRRAWK